jgi:hypothetical protein
VAASWPAVMIPHFRPTVPITGHTVTMECASAYRGRSTPKYVLNTRTNTRLSGVMFAPE